MFFNKQICIQTQQQQKNMNLHKISNLPHNQISEQHQQARKCEANKFAECYHSYFFHNLHDFDPSCQSCQSSQSNHSSQSSLKKVQQRVKSRLKANRINGHSPQNSNNSNSYSKNNPKLNSTPRLTMKSSSHQLESTRANQTQLNILQQQNSDLKKQIAGLKISQYYQIDELKIKELLVQIQILKKNIKKVKEQNQKLRIQNDFFKRANFQLKVENNRLKNIQNKMERQPEMGKNYQKFNNNQVNIQKDMYKTRKKSNTSNKNLNTERVFQSKDKQKLKIFEQFSDLHENDYLYAQKRNTQRNRVVGSKIPYMQNSINNNIKNLHGHQYTIQNGNKYNVKSRQFKQSVINSQGPQNQLIKQPIYNQNNLNYYHSNLNENNNQKRTSLSKQKVSTIALRRMKSQKYYNFNHKTHSAQVQQIVKKLNFQ